MALLNYPIDLAAPLNLPIVMMAQLNQTHQDQKPISHPLQRVFTRIEENLIIEGFLGSKEDL